MKPKEPNSVARALAKQPPWKGTPAEPLLRKLVPRSEPWASEAEQFRSYIWAVVQRISRDARQPPLTPARRARNLAHEHAGARAKANALTVGEPGYEQAQIEALKARWNARIQKMDVREMRKAIEAEFGVAPPNRSGGGERLAHLLLFIRTETGKPHYASVARMLALAGWQVQPEALRMAAIKKPKK